MKLMTACLFIYEAEVLLVVHAKHNRAIDAEFQHIPPLLFHTPKGHDPVIVNHIGV